jgi:excisionase family DNA binding protein
VPQPDLEDSFLTVAEVAEKLKLNQQTVRNWIDQGSLPAVRVGRRVRIRRSDYERVLAAGYSGRRGRGESARAGADSRDFRSAAPGGQSSAARGESVATASGSSAEASESSGRAAQPSAEDFWSGEVVGVAEAPRRPTDSDDKA